MLTFRPDTSFPFLAIARRHNVSYQSVLTIAEGIEDGSIHVGKFVGGTMGDIKGAVEAERERRKLVKTGL